MLRAGVAYALDRFVAALPGGQRQATQVRRVLARLPV
jgi:ABC-type hemin transport system ATPase subunit